MTKDRLQSVGVDTLGVQNRSASMPASVGREVPNTGDCLNSISVILAEGTGIDRLVLSNQKRHQKFMGGVLVVLHDRFGYSDIS